MLLWFSVHDRSLEWCKSGNKHFFSTWWMLLTPAVSWGQWKCTIRAQQSCAADRSPVTHLATHTEHNLAIDPSPAFLCCHRDHISSPVSLPDQAPGFIKHPQWRFLCLFFLNRSSTYLACVDRVPILWAGSSALTTTSTDNVASTSLLPHSPRPKMTRCLGSGRGTWTWKHFRLDLLRIKHIWAVALRWKTTLKSTFGRYLMNWRGASRKDHST